mmetsp:Transcript_7885/g.20872  ORF Transcript_7885/g.20872 Transcript_7885/m.20872 type:complete len:370 (-) Transcript_7885:9-1118(-)
MPVEIRNVWQHNLEKEIAIISRLVERYSIVAMDTEFPGVVARPVGGFRNNSDYQYQTLRCNVDLLKIIQLGLAFGNERGELAPECPCWQFNFKFNLAEDMYAQDSIDLLTQSGIAFDEFEQNGIDVLHFGELLVSSGLVLNEDVTWISFHSSFDFGYLLKVLTCSNLPSDEADFFALMSMYFPRFWDMKYLMTDRFFGGLSKLAEFYDVSRYGQMHQAGSDSLLTLEVFYKMRDVTFSGHIQQDMMNVLYGLGQGHNPAASSANGSSGTTYVYSRGTNGGPVGSSPTGAVMTNSKDGSVQSTMNDDAGAVKLAIARVDSTSGAGAIKNVPSQVVAAATTSGASVAAQHSSKGDQQSSDDVKESLVASST